MQKIVPFLWFHDQAHSAIRLYTSLFSNAHIDSIQHYPSGYSDGPLAGMDGKILNAIFTLAGQRFMALDGGPVWSFTPAISFFVNNETEAQINDLWEALAEGGKVFMPLDVYPFSQKFGWLQDAYGVSWQLNLDGKPQSIAPFLMFVGDQSGKAQEALQFYTSLFPNSAIEHLEHDDKGGARRVQHATFRLHGQTFMAIDSDITHDFSFSGANSFYVDCDSQEEVDYLWEALSAVPQAEQCGWLQDKYGISWQIIPKRLGQLMTDPDPRRATRAMNAMLQMKKIDIAELERAANG